MPGQPFKSVPDGLVLHVRLTPKGGRDAIDGIETLSDGKIVLKARVRAVPEDGKANDALIKLIAKEFGVPASHVSLAAGATSRVKVLKIKGEATALVAALSAALPST